MATYGTDLSTLTDAESGTWTEFTNYALGATPALDGENYIQGQDCYSQATGQKTGLSFSIVFDNGADHSSNIGTGDVYLAWIFYAVGVNLQTYSTGGLWFAIGSSLTALDRWIAGGSDFGRNPYGGWFCFAVDPTNTSRTQDSGGNGGSYRYFGPLLNHINKITKGTPFAVDAIRFGRGEIYCTGTGCTFTGLAQYNDYNDGTNGYNRFGLFQDNGGTYLWKGLMSLGQTGTSATFSDSNKTIVVEDADKTYTAFNKIEVNNASTSVTWTNITFISLGTVSPGAFEMVDNGTVTWTGCAFNDFGTFVFDTNGDVSGTAFNGCGRITGGGADFDSCSFNKTSDATAGVQVDTLAEAALIQNSTFTSSGTKHGLQIGDGTAVLSTASITLTNLVFSGYDTADPGTAANKAIWVNSGSGGGTITLNISGGSGVTAAAHVRATNCTVVVSADTTVTFTGMRDYTEVLVQKVSDGSEIAHSEDHLDTGGGAQGGTTNNRTFAWSAASGTAVRYVLHNYNASGPDYETIRVNSYTVPANDTSIAIAQRLDRNSV